MRDDLGNRMKSHERLNQNFLTRKFPAVGRIDGKAFHTFTKSMVQPFDERMVQTMIDTAEYLMDELQGAKFGYVQSDEISILLTDYDRENTDAWFAYNVQKMASVSASMATLAFNNAMESNFDIDWVIRQKAPALFDSRWFTLDHTEVANYFIWRQADCARNSVSAYARHFFSQKQLNGKSRPEMILMLEEINKSWYELPVHLQMGTALYKVPDENGRLKTKVDTMIPVFTKDRDFVDNHTYLRGYYQNDAGA